MNKNSRALSRKIRLTLLLFLFLLMNFIIQNSTINSTYAMPKQAANKQIVISPYKVNLNFTINVPILITNAENVAGGSIKINFNKFIIIVEEATEGDFGYPIVNIDNEDGFIYLAVAQATAVGKTNATLAFVEFKGVGEGYANVFVENPQLNDEEGHVIVPDVISEDIYVIPEFPHGSVLLLFMMSTLIAVTLFRKRRRYGSKEKRYIKITDY